MSRRKNRKTPSPSTAEFSVSEQIRNSYTPLEVLTRDDLDKIHDGAMRILEEIGLEILNAQALDVYEANGARVEREADDCGKVFIDRSTVIEHLKTVPSTFTLHGRIARRNCEIGGNAINFTTVASAPNSSDLDRGRRSGNFEDYCNFLRLAQGYDVIGFLSGYPVEPIDLPPATRHLDATFATLTLTDRAFHCYSLGGGRVTDGIEMTRIARGIDIDTLKHEPSIVTVVNTNSPLRVDGPMLDGLIEMVQLGQPVIVTPFTLAGAMCPITLAGALAQQTAEALGVIALSQMIAPGAPMVFGGFTSNCDMKSGAPAFGTPEYARAVLAGGQLARYYGLPYRSSNTNASNYPDAQAAWESQMSLWGVVMGHANVVKHAAGWLEGGLCASFEKFILDIEMVQMMVETLKPIEVSEDTLGLESIRQAGHGGHFFATDHTMARYDSAFYAPIASDWNNFETWTEGGSLRAEQRANAIYKQRLSEYTEPPMDGAIRDELERYVSARRAEIEAAG
ncbi:MAG: trimethylamine methyltransferase family protein [Pseudomonadota bacterium]